MSDDTIPGRRRSPPEPSKAMRSGALEAREHLKVPLPPPRTSPAQQPPGSEPPGSERLRPSPRRRASSSPPARECARTRTSPCRRPRRSAVPTTTRRDRAAPRRDRREPENFEDEADPASPTTTSPEVVRRGRPGTRRRPPFAPGSATPAPASPRPRIGDSRPAPAPSAAAARPAASAETAPKRRADGVSAPSAADRRLGGVAAGPRASSGEQAHRSEQRCPATRLQPGGAPTTSSCRRPRCAQRPARARRRSVGARRATRARGVRRPLPHVVHALEGARTTSRVLEGRGLVEQPGHAEGTTR